MSRVVHRHRVAADAPATSVLVDAVVLGSAVALSMTPLLPVYGGGAVLPTIVGAVVLGGGAAVLAARRRWSPLLTSGFVFLVYLLAGGPLAVPKTAVAGLLPTAGSVSALLSGPITVWKGVLTLQPEFGSGADLLIAPYLLGLVGSAVGVSVAARASRRTGTWAGLVAVAVLGISLLLGTKQSVNAVVAGVVLVALLLPWAAWRWGDLAPRRVVALLVVGAAALGGAVVGGPVLGESHPRFVLRDEMVPPFDPSDHPSPLSAFRAFAKQWADTPLLTVHGLPAGARVRLATMDAFDGVVWNVAGSELAAGSGAFRQVGDSISTPVLGTPAHVEFEAHDLPMVWLPTVGYATRISFAGGEAQSLASDLRYNDATGTAVLTGGVPAGARWSEDAVIPVQPSDAEMGGATAGPVRLPRATGVPEAVAFYADEVAGEASSPALIANNLEAGLADVGWFSHGVSETDYPSLSGHGSDRITTLLTGELMVGDGEQYASAMALMARQMGLPSRVVLGFVPDADATGEDVVITGSNIQAWVEIEFTGRGWVTFDPTPSEDRVPTEDTPQEEPEPEPQVRQPPPPLSDPVNPPEDAVQQPQTRDAERDLKSSEQGRQALVLTAVVGVPFILVCIPLLLIGLAKHRRRRRRRTAGDPAARVAGGWDELLDEARDLHRASPATATRQEAAEHFSRVFVGRRRRRRRTDVGGTVSGLAAHADASVFGPGQPPDWQVDEYWRQVDKARRAMRSVVPRRHRLRSRWTTASLRSRRAARRRGDEART